MIKMKCPHCSGEYEGEAEELAEHLISYHNEDPSKVESYISNWSPFAEAMAKVRGIEPEPKVVKSENPKLDVGSKKLGFQSIPPSAFAYLAQAMNDGARKYGGRNWRDSKVVMSIYLDAIMRHLLCVMDGDDIADDSKLDHLAHIMANCAIILDAKKLNKIIDDRFTNGNVSDIMKESNSGI